MAYELTFDVFKNIFVDTNMMGINWIIPLIVIFLTLIIITRETDKWKILAFPVAVLWRIVGLKVSFLILGVTAILFVIESLSTQIMSNIVRAVRERTTDKGIKEKELRNVGKLADERSKIMRHMSILKKFNKEQGL